MAAVCSIIRFIKQREEWWMMPMPHQVAREVLRVGRQILVCGLVVGTWGNISVRSQPGGFVITPSGISYDNLNEADLVVVDERGERIAGNRQPSSERLLHAAIYQARPDVRGIVHTHSLYASVFAVNREEIPVVIEEQAQLLGGPVEVAKYASPGSQALADTAVVALGERSAVLLANHGLVGVGRCLDEALLVCQVVEKGAQVYLMARLSGHPALLAEVEVANLRHNFLAHYGQRDGRKK
jgi:L-fuculose-phosphate aldolase